MEGSLRRCVEEGDQPAAKVIGSEVVLPHAVEQPHLISCAAHRDVGTSLVRQRRECTVPDIRGHDQRQEDDVPLIALKCGRPPAAQTVCLHRLGVEPLRKLVLDKVRLRVPLQSDDADRLPLVALVVDGPLDVLDDCRRLGPIEDSCALSFTRALGDEP